MPGDNRTREELMKDIEDLRYRLEDAEASLDVLRSGAAERDELERAAQSKFKVEERLRYALETGNIGSWDLDLGDHTAYRSLEHDRIFGYETPLPEWSYEIFLSHVLPEERDEVDATFRKTMAGQDNWNFTCRIRRADGEVRWIWASGRHYSEEAGSRRGMAGVVRDITEEKNAQRALEESETRYRSLFENSLEAIFTLDGAGRLSLANPASERISGYSPEELTNKNFAELCTPDLVLATQAAFLDVLNGAPREIETAMIRKDGRRVELLVSGAPMVVDGSVQGVFCVAIDITARKQAEEALHRYELLAGHSHDIILFMEFDSGQILEVNVAAVTAYGYTREELLERTIHDLRAHETSDVTSTQMARAASRGIQFETVHRRKDGSTFPVEVSSQGAMIGRTQTLISVVRDITKRKQEEAYRSMGQDILLVLNENNNPKEAIKRVIGIIKSATGVDAVGIRLQDEDDFPYFYQDGFPQDFLLKENSLLTRTRDGGICRDEDGNICLECTCGLVVTSKTDSSSPLFTKGGSSWTNDSFPFLHVPADNDIRTNPRNECIHQGFASVALIPIRAKGRVVGLLQLNDRRKGCFTLEGIETLEKIAENVGESMLRKQAEEALRESNEQFTTLADSIPNLAWWANGDGYITWYNRRWYEYTGTTLEEMEGWGWQNVHDLSTLPRVLQQWQKSIATGQPFEMEFPLRGADGVYRTFLTRSIPMKDSNGNVVRWFGTNTDISAQKEVEEQLKQSEERQRLLAETMLQGVVHQDANGKIISMNPAAERILGRSQEDLLGGSSVAVEHDTIRENGEIFPGLEHPTMVALRTGLPVRSVVMGVFNPKLQEYRWIGIDAVPVFRPGEDRPSEVYSIFGDISERKQAQKALQEEHDVLEQRVTERTMDLSATINHLQSEILERELAEMKLREETAARMQATESLREKERMFILQSRQAAMGEMIGNIAHQWRQPLNVLGLNIQKLMLYYDLGEFTREFLENSVNKSMDVIQHMSSTIDDFRNFFKPDKKPAEFRVSGAITRTLALVGESFKNDAIGIDVITKDDAVINGYTNEYAQVVLNILNNARDVLLERGIKDPRVTITLCAEEGKSVVTIADNAGGIPEEIMEKIFDPYFTTKGPQTGTGLGLFMSKSIIEKNMNGRLTARNIVDGAQFRIEV